MASSSNTSKSDDHQQHNADKEAANQKQNDKESSSWSSSKQMKYIAFVVLVIIVVMSAAMGTIWGVVKPKRPVYAIEYGHIERTLAFNHSGTSFTGNFSFVMRAYNPNKKSTIYYESMKIYNTTDSGNETAIPVRLVANFTQPPFNVTRINFTFWTTFLSDDGDSILEHLLHGRLTANISVKAKMRFGYGSWKSMPHAIGIYCQPAAILLKNNFQTTDCFVDL